MPPMTPQNTVGVTGGTDHCQDRDPPEAGLLPLVCHTSQSLCGQAEPRQSLPLLLEVGVQQGLVGGDALVRVIGHHCVQKGETLRGQSGCQLRYS